jgi:hypothetical protein
MIYNGAEIARKAFKGSESKDIYFDFGRTCIGPIHANRCVNSSGC